MTLYLDKHAINRQKFFEDEKFDEIRQSTLPQTEYDKLNSIVEDWLTGWKTSLVKRSRGSRLFEETKNQQWLSCIHLYIS